MHLRLLGFGRNGTHMSDHGALRVLLQLSVDFPLSDSLAHEVLAILTTPLHPRLRLQYDRLELDRRLEFVADLVLFDASDQRRFAVAAAEKLRRDTTLITAFPDITFVGRRLRKPTAAH
jgi:hypothetical protein